MPKKQSVFQKIIAWLKSKFFPTTDPPPSEPPVEPPVDPPVVPPATGDELDITKVVWDEPAGNVGSWPVTASFTGLRWNGDGCSVSGITGTYTWALAPEPNPKQTIGNWWLLAECEDGITHGATMEWLGRGKLGFTGKKWDGTDATHGCLTNWKPKSGAIIYIMISTCARAGVQNGRERSAAIKLVLP
jgi:hypothetical protein